MTLPILQRLLALVSLAFAVVGGYLLWSWWDLREALARMPGVVRADPQDWRLWVGGVLAVWWLAGRLPMALLLGRGADDRVWLTRGPAGEIATPDGALLRTETYGPESAPVIVLVHGWGMDRRTWRRIGGALSERYQVMAYDLAGLGQSRGPKDGVYDLDRLAEHLAAVVGAVGRRRVVLVGHSIGGMIVQTYCANHREALGERVAGIVLCNTTHLDPTTTMIGAPVFHALKPLLIFAMRMMVWLEPLAWLMNWQGYLSGSTHLAMRLGGFGTRPTRSELELVARDATTNRPAVQAKGNIAMMTWDVTEALPRIGVPALVFTGGKDIVTLPRAGETIAERLPHALRRPVARAGHLGPMECADDYARSILDFADAAFTRGARFADRAAMRQAASPTEPRSPSDRGRPYAS